jgi:hypothetical protein
MALTSLSGPTCLRATSLSRRRRPVIELRLIDVRRASAIGAALLAGGRHPATRRPAAYRSTMLTSDQSAAYDTAVDRYLQATQLVTTGTSP